MSKSPMTMNPEYLKYCRYYKGEETIPWEKDYAKFTRFWILERDYYTSEYENNHEYWENKGQELCDPPELKKFLSKIKDKTIRGFVACSAVFSYSHNPAGGMLFMLKYKYDGDNAPKYKSAIRQNPIEKEYRFLYYHKEDECPYDLRTIQSSFWRIEKIWDIIVRDDEIERSNKESEFLVDFPDAIEDVESVPVSLKATLYDQFCRFGGDKYGFKDYLNEYLTNTPNK